MSEPGPWPPAATQGNLREGPILDNSSNLDYWNDSQFGGYISTSLEGTKSNHFKH